MQIKKLKIDNYKCLQNFEMNLSVNNSGSVCIFIGENGSGKTTTLEAILKILMSFDSDAIEKQIDFNYELEYYFGGENICIKKENRDYKILINDELLLSGKMATIKKNIGKIQKRLFPQRIIAFYSGENNKFLVLAKRVNINYNFVCRNVVEHFCKTMLDDTATFLTPLPKKKYNYCDDNLIPIYLSSILGGENSFEKNYLQEKMWI